MWSLFLGASLHMLARMIIPMILPRGAKVGLAVIALVCFSLGASNTIGSDTSLLLFLAVFAGCIIGLTWKTRSYVHVAACTLVGFVMLGWGAAIGDFFRVDLPEGFPSGPVAFFVLEMLFAAPYMIPLMLIVALRRRMAARQVA